MCVCIKFISLYIYHPLLHAAPKRLPRYPGDRSPIRGPASGVAVLRGFDVYCFGFQAPKTGVRGTLHPTPHTPHPTPYTLHPTPHTLHPTPYTPHEGFSFWGQG